MSAAQKFFPKLKNRADQFFASLQNFSNTQCKKTLRSVFELLFIRSSLRRHDSL
ncbi:Uncharacterized protein dnm_071790 [Desulfonema magnum]|uniref:Uncharacterized protein n=1 Tax=Desulfonema magnum TaxID=45655 RepID=A0A975BSQ3_9BACT|nr:Uncharacterized protein dnm_071790 [Desulfonema magnum]